MEVEVDRLTKSYDGRTYALCEVSLRLGPGIAGLVGPNGAGKTTLMRSLATLLRPTAGTARFDGHDILSDPMFARHHLGYLPQDFGLYPQLTAEQFLDFLARLDGVRERAARREHVARALATVHLTADARKRLGAYSGGMRQRIGIAQALMRDPAVLILDEPTAGLDPAERQDFHSLLALLGARMTILLSSHILSDIANICSQVFVIAQGRLKASGTPDDLIAALQGQVFECLVNDAQMSEVAQRGQILFSRREAAGIIVRLYTVDPSTLPADAHPVPPSLDDAYLIFTGANLEQTSAFNQAVRSA